MHAGHMLIGMFGRIRLFCPRGICCSILCALTLAMFTTSAFAQRQDAAPQPNLLKAPAVWLGLLVMFVLLAIVISVSLMPSKRSHQD